MQYLWINPVSAGMCEEDSLKRFLERHGLTRVECRGDWGRIVRERYEASLRAGVTLADARCPEAVRLLEEIQKESENESGIENLKVAPIEPILLHCARELSTRPDLADGEKIITTPCQSLAVLGNSLGLENTRFIAWNRLAGGAKYARGRRPVELVYSESFHNKQDAQRREYAIKQMTKTKKLRLIEGAK